MSSDIDYKKEYDETYDKLEEFLGILEDPVKYRKEFKDTFEQEIFELLKDDLIEYMKINTEFRKSIISVFEPENPRVRNPFTTPPRSSFKRNNMIYTPRSSSRPSLD